MGVDNISSLNLKNTFSNNNIKKYNVKNNTLNLTRIDENLRLSDLAYNNNNIKDEVIHLNSKSKNNVEKEIKINSKVDNSGKFSKFTDYQNVMSSNFILLEDINVDIGKSGKTINELYKEYKDDAAISKKLESLIQNGFGKLKIVEIISGEDGFDAIVLQDIDGDYNIFYPGTNWKEIDDFSYDMHNLVDLITPDDIYKLTIDNDESENIVEGLFCSAMGYNPKKYHSQQNQARDLAEKYIDKAVQEDVQLNFSGYSLGASLAEESYLSIANNSFEIFEKMAVYTMGKAFCSKFSSFVLTDIATEIISKEIKNIPVYKSFFSKFSSYLEGIDKKQDYLGTLALYNAYHDDLSRSEVKILKESGNLKLYAAEGDMVSALFNYEDFKDITKYIYVDYKSEYKQAKKKIDESGGGTILNPNMIEKNFGISTDLIDFFLPKNWIKNLNYIDAIFDGAHSLESIKEIAFDESGSAKKEVKLSKEEVHIINSKNFSSLSKEVLGFDYVKDLKDVTKAVCQGYEVLLGAKEFVTFESFVKASDNLLEDFMTLF